MKFHLQHRLLATGLAAFMGVTGVSAQQDQQRNQGENRNAATQQREADRPRQRDREDRQQDQRERTRDQRRSDRDQSWRESDRQRDRAERVRVTPAGWIRVASDRDNDGRFESVETIYLYDFEKARESSRRRANAEAQKLPWSQSRQAETRNASRRSQRRVETVKGEIQNLRQEQFAGIDGKSTVAQIKTQNDRTARVLLGSQSQLKDWKLQDGDQITVTGQRARINDRPVLMAKQIQHDGQQLSVRMPSSRNVKRVKGEVLTTREARFRGRGNHLLAQVELVSGKREIVNLGPVDKVEKLDLEEGDQVSMIVRPARVNGQPAMVAEQIRSGNKSVEIPRRRNAGRGSDRVAGRRPSQRTEARDQQNRRGERAEGRGARYSERRDQTLDPERRAALGVSLQQTDQGPAIAQIHPGTPAAKSDLQEGDQIIAVGDKQVESVREVSEAIHQASPDESVDIQVRRDGKKKTFTIRLAKFADLREQR